MLIFLLQLRESVTGLHHEVYLFALFTAIVWTIWIVKMVLSVRYRPWSAAYRTTTSVVVPVVDEPLELFRDVLARIVAQGPHEVIVVVNGKRNLALESVCAEFPSVRTTWTQIAGKRNAVRIGVEMATGDIVALVDSDTIWAPAVLDELVKPFRDRGVGGVTTRQRILDADRSFLTRWADWLENSRSLYAMPAQSALGQVGCLPGRTIAFRREILVRVMDDFMGQQFLGVFLEVSDDRTLTNLTLKQGYRTVYQHTSLVYTDAPTQLRKLYKQQLRWARGSQYNTLRMLPWMLSHAPVLAFFFLMDIVLPFLLLGAVGGWVYRNITHTGYNYYKPILANYDTWTGVLLVVTMMVLASWLSMALRQMRHLAEKPRDIMFLPLFIVFSTIFLMPIRIVGFFKMAHSASWGTRAGAYDGGPLTFADSELAAVPAPGHSSSRVLAPALVTRARTRVQAPPRRRFNVQAGIPYVLGSAIVALEVLLYV